MRRIVIAIGTTLSALVLLFSWPTSRNSSTQATATDTGGGGTTSGTTTAGGTTADSGATTAGGTTADGTTAGGTTTATDGTTATAAPAAPTTATYDGDSTATRYGNVQVRITVTDGAVTSAEAIAFPGGERESVQINARAIPILNQEASAAGSADISMVSGATVTSRGYLTSLQSALDRAGL
ncbi:FMN-binding protein [Pengzhenrongella sicca]|uniref:FMN-binding protein n=1 Tax=Pengzhenrongella sicca TaxID=2819238 RepID=A0A8A4ZD19_9MICO|nr:FMN-binding protein [Pengzhenrongella sicca]QTE29245.1 FMN-binding protein [Pengzhenrongella sicca]